ncbi:hypothetical protein OEZ86_004790 [Tetradesmus obliquus]|nr:hypothetical protein OEZ86_004790 [Tetradesmus obliquus]
MRSSGGLGSSLRSHAYDVYGQPRAAQVSLPASHLKSQAPAALNSAYLAKELPAMRSTKTSSACLIQHSGKAGKQLALSPGHIHFGSVAQGSVVHRTARVLNVSTGVARFSISRPELPLRVLYKPGPLPAGMEATFTLELVAEQPGDFVGEVVLKSEVNVLTLTVSAKVLPAAQPEAAAAAAGAADDEDGEGGTAAAGCESLAASPVPGAADA